VNYISDLHVLEITLAVVTSYLMRMKTQKLAVIVI